MNTNNTLNGANTAQSLAPLFKDTYPSPKKAESKRKKKRFSKIEKILSRD